MKEIVLLNTNKRAFVDDEDYIRILSSLPKNSNWSMHSKGYAQYQYRIHGINKHVFMHSLVMCCTNNSLQMLDHINGNRLDNRKENLRFCTQRQNLVNRKTTARSGCRGVNFNSKMRDRKYAATIAFNGKTINLGHFADKTDAAIAYNIAAMKLNGDFAQLNTIQDNLLIN